MDRKIIGILLVLLAITLVPGVFADDNNTIDSNTVEEVKAINSPYGAEVRLLQLEKSITRNILVGAEVVEVIQTNHPEADLNTAQTKLDEMEILLADVKSYDTTGKDKNLLVADFVGMKKEAITLTQEFRTATAEFLTAEDRQQIKNALKDLDKNQLKNVNQQIKQAVRTFNAQRVEEILSIMGVENSELIQKITDGNATVKEVKEAVKAAYLDLNAEEQKLVWAQIKEKAAKRIVAEKALIEKAIKGGKEKFLQIEANRMQKLSDWLEKRGQDLNANGFNERANRILDWSDKLENKSNKIRNRD